MASHASLHAFPDLLAPCVTLEPLTLVGEASAGKTQTCMQLLMTAQWPAAEGGLDGDALCARAAAVCASSRRAEVHAAQCVTRSFHAQVYLH